MPEATTVRVELEERSYDIRIGAGRLDELGPAASDLVAGRRAFLVIDDNLPDAVVQRAVTSLENAGFNVAHASIHALETKKILRTVESLLDAVGRARCERDDPIIPLGGGVTGDVGGFVAASWRRGVPVIQCPTTLLAMVDASVGGKTGVNLAIDGNLRKNMVGAFWQPRLVVADLDALDSLPSRELRAGLAECLKHGLVADHADPDLFDWTVNAIDDIRNRDKAALDELVARNVRVKADIVAADERETTFTARGRPLLNLGHTFAHAIEPRHDLTPDGDPDHTPLMHGEAVAYGLLAAAATARQLDMIDDHALDRIRRGVLALGLRPTLDALPDDDELLDAMGHDKKVAGGRLRLVLPCGDAASRVVNDPPRDAVAAGWAALRS